MTETAENLTIEELLWAAANSNSKSVKDALQKLEMVVRLAHSEEQIHEMMRARPEYRLRIGIPSEKGPYKYQYLRIAFVGNAVDIAYEDWGCFTKLSTHTENLLYIKE